MLPAACTARLASLRYQPSTPTQPPSNRSHPCSMVLPRFFVAGRGRRQHAVGSPIGQRKPCYRSIIYSRLFYFYFWIFCASFRNYERTIGEWWLNCSLDSSLSFYIYGYIWFDFLLINERMIGEWWLNRFLVSILRWIFISMGIRFGFPLVNERMISEWWLNRFVASILRCPFIFIGIFGFPFVDKWKNGEWWLNRLDSSLYFYIYGYSFGKWKNDRWVMIK